MEEDSLLSHFQKARIHNFWLPFRSCDFRIHCSQPDLPVKLWASWFVLKKGNLNETNIHTFSHIFESPVFMFILFHDYVDSFLFTIKQTPPHPCKAWMGLTHSDVPENLTTQNVACSSEEPHQGAWWECKSPLRNENLHFKEIPRWFASVLAIEKSAPGKHFVYLRDLIGGGQSKVTLGKGKIFKYLSVKYSLPFRNTCRTYNERWAGLGKSSTSSPYGMCRRK